MIRVKTLGIPIGLAAMTVALAACGSDKPAAPAEAAPPKLEIATQIKVPDGNQQATTLDADGVQVYQCTDSAWKLLEPGATLSQNGKTVALHSRGPVWVSTVDGSTVTAAAVPGASVARPNAVPELLLKATGTRGDGVFGRVTYVQRLKTEGGVSPSGSCNSGTQTAVHYAAVYVFYTAA